MSKVVWSGLNGVGGWYEWKGPDDGPVQGSKHVVLVINIPLLY